MKIKTLAILALVASFSTSCVGTFTGGGFIPAKNDPNGKAIFAFNADAKDNDDDGEAETFRGQIQYQDASANIRVHVDLATVYIADPDPVTGLPTARVSGQTANGAFFSATLEDHGQRGMTSDDKVSVSIIDFTNFSWYIHSGTVVGGQITYHPPK